MSKSLGDYIVDRTESLNDNTIKDYFISRNDGKIVRLLDSEQYIFEGSRGIGKTMLMRFAEIQAKKDFNKESVLAVWISFEESLNLERISIIDSKAADPFLQWTMGKILLETLKKIISLKPSCENELSERLSKIFNRTITDKVERYEHYTNLLNAYVEVLQQGDIKSNDELNEKTPSLELMKILDNPSSFKEFLLSICEEFELQRIVFLFDEAAHVFSYSQQEKFFTLFKSLRNPQIACKAAVYPGITNYGKYFEKGQDAKELRIDWTPNNELDVNYINKILKVRIQKNNQEYWNLLTKNKDIINTICICSNGNPRFAFHIIDELDNINAFKKKTISHTQIIGVIRKVFDNKWKEFSTLQERMPKYKSYIKEAELFIKEVIVPNLRNWNIKRRDGSKKLSSGFYIETVAYDKIHEIFDILAYYNIITINYSKKSLGKGGYYGYYITLNPSILFSDLIIKDVQEISDMSIAIENNQAYFMSTTQIQELCNKVKIQNEYKCNNKNCTFKTSEEYNFCPICGSKIEKEEEVSLYRILRSHSIDNLGLSEFIKDKLKSKFNTIGEIQDASPDEIRMRQIQDVRIDKIKNAVTEYMAG